MATGSLGMTGLDDEEELSASVQPLNAEDRRSQSLRSPNFQLADESQDQVAPDVAPVQPAPEQPAGPLRDATPMGQVQVPQQDPGFGLPPEATKALSALDKINLGQPVTPAELQAVTQSGITPQMPRDPNVGAGRRRRAATRDEAGMAWGEAWQRNEAVFRGQVEKAAKEAQKGRFQQLKALGVEFETLPDGTETLAAHPDGTPRFKRGWAADINQDAETGRFYRPWRDERGGLHARWADTDPDLHRIDSNTGEKYVTLPGGVRQVVGMDDWTVAVNRVKVRTAEASMLSRQEREDLAKFEEENLPAIEAWTAIDKRATAMHNQIQSLRGQLEENPKDKRTKQSLERIEQVFNEQFPDYEEQRERGTGLIAEIETRKAKMDGLREEASSLRADRSYIEAVRYTDPAAVDMMRELAGGAPGGTSPLDVEARSAALVAEGKAGSKSAGSAMALRELQERGIETWNGQPMEQAIARREFAASLVDDIGRMGAFRLGENTEGFGKALRSEWEQTRDFILQNDDLKAFEGFATVDHWARLNRQFKVEKIMGEAAEAQARADVERAKREYREAGFWQAWGEEITGRGAAQRQRMENDAPMGRMFMQEFEAQARSGTFGFVRSASSLVTGIAATGSMFFGSGPIADRAGVKLAKMVDDYWSDLTPEQDRDSAGAWLGSLMGSGASFLIPIGIAGRVSAAVGLGGKTVSAFGRKVAADRAVQFAVAGAFGAPMNGGMSVIESMEMGLSDDEAWSRFGFAFGMGTSEALGLGRLLGRLDKFVGGSMKRFFHGVVREAFEEGAQELIQEGAMGIYDALKHDKNWKEVWGEALEGGFGGVVMGTLFAVLLGGSMNAAQRRRLLSLRDTASVDSGFGAIHENTVELRQKLAEARQAGKLDIVEGLQDAIRMNEDVLRQSAARFATLKEPDFAAVGEALGIPNAQATFQAVNGNPDAQFPAIEIGRRFRQAQIESFNAVNRNAHEVAAATAKQNKTEPPPPFREQLPEHWRKINELAEKSENPEAVKLAAMQIYGQEVLQQALTRAVRTGNVKQADGEVLNDMGLIVRDGQSQDGVPLWSITPDAVRLLPESQRVLLEKSDNPAEEASRAAQRARMRVAVINTGTESAVDALALAGERRAKEYADKARGDTNLEADAGKKSAVAAPAAVAQQPASSPVDGASTPVDAPAAGAVASPGEYDQTFSKPGAENEVITITANSKEEARAILERGEGDIGARKADLRKRGYMKDGDIVEIEPPVMAAAAPAAEAPVKQATGKASSEAYLDLLREAGLEVKDVDLLVNRAIAPMMDLLGKVTTRVEFVDRGSKAVNVTKDNVLELNREFLNQQYQMDGGAALQGILGEEFLHGASNAAGVGYEQVWASLPETMQEAVLEAYPALREAGVTDWSKGGETFRMLLERELVLDVQGDRAVLRSGDGQLSEELRPSALSHIMGAIRKLREYLGNLWQNLTRDGASPEAIEFIRAERDKVVALLRDMGVMDGGPAAEQQQQVEQETPTSEAFTGSVDLDAQGRWVLEKPDDRGGKPMQIRAELDIIDLESPEVIGSEGTIYQPRMRGVQGDMAEKARVQSELNVRNLRDNWNPAKSLPNTQFDKGPMLVVDPVAEARAISGQAEATSQVISGHGRMRAKQELYAKRPDAAQADRAFLVSHLESIGRPDLAEKARNAKVPALAGRVVDMMGYKGQPAPLLQLVRDANPTGMSAVESAVSDAALLRSVPELLSSIEFTEGGEFSSETDTISALGRLVELLGIESMLTGDGRVTDAVHDRVRNAMLAFSMGADTAIGRQGGIGQMLTTLMEQAGMHGLVNFRKQLVRHAPTLARLDGKSDAVERFLAPLIGKFVAWKSEGGKGTFSDAFKQNSFEFMDGPKLDLGEMSATERRLVDALAGDGSVAQAVQALVDEADYGGALFAQGSVTPEADARYLAAVERGDMETAQRMVDEAAKKAGYKIKGFHGTTSKDSFNVFDDTVAPPNIDPATQFVITPIGEGWNPEGIHIGTEEQARKVLDLRGVQEGGGRVIPLFAKAAKIKRGVDDGWDWRQIIVKAKKAGYDALVYKNEFEGPGNSYVLFYNYQVKRADPVTYDADGNVIPLSRRFNPDSDSILYAQSTRKNAPGDYPVSLAEAIRSTTVSSLEHRDGYDEAKRGSDGDAAMRVVMSVVSPKAINELRLRLDSDRPVVFVPVVHHDIGRRTNALPVAYAQYLAMELGGEVEENITKRSGNANTHVSVQDRMANQQKFEGSVQSGVQYVVVDDNWTSGDTVVSLVDHILENGGGVAAITTLAASQSQNYVKPRDKDVRKLLARTGVSELTLERELGFPIKNFTGSELFRIVNLNRGWQGLAGFLSQVPDRGREADSQGSTAGVSSDKRQALGGRLREERATRELLSAQAAQTFPDMAADERAGVVAAADGRVAAQREGIEQSEQPVFKLSTQAAEAWPVTDDPGTLEDGQFLPAETYDKWILDHYRDTDAVAGAKANSRTTPMRALPLRVGMWMIDRFNGLYGREIAQLRSLDTTDLMLSEDLVEGNFEGRGWDSERYRQWLDDGLIPPPIRVIETDAGNLRVSDGHRRYHAHKAAGRPILAWVYPAVEHPQGLRRDGGTGAVLKVGLTAELARGARGALFAQGSIDPAEAITPENKVAPSIAGKPAGQIFDEAKQRHGVTRSIYEAGYVLPDGTMLDFSGRSQNGDFVQGNDLTFRSKPGVRDWMRDQRGMDHREIEWDGMPEYSENWERMVAFLRLGAVRVDANSGMISMHSRSRITAAQVARLKDIIVAGDGAYLDLEDDAGNRVAVSIESNKWGKVHGILTRWANGESPETQTLFAQDSAPTEQDLDIARRGHAALWRIKREEGRLTEAQQRRLEEFDRVLGQQVLFDLGQSEVPRRQMALDELNPEQPALRASNATIVGPGQLTLFAQNAYHGTPHEIDPATGFRLDRIGTGEGAQAYGWGLYFSEARKVGETYAGIEPKVGVAAGSMRLVPTDGNMQEWNDLLNQESAIGSMLVDEMQRRGHLDRQIAKRVGHRVAESLAQESNDPNLRKSYEKLASMLESGKLTFTDINRGNLYRVELDVEPDQLLDWDKPLGEQSEKVRDAFNSWLSNDIEAFNAAMQMTGQQWYSQGNDGQSGAKRRSEFLLSIGIPGIRYLDEGSRISQPAIDNIKRMKDYWENLAIQRPEYFTEEGVSGDNARAELKKAREDFEKIEQQTYNYVIFDESKIKITERNGEPVTMAEAMESAAVPDESQMALFAQAPAFYSKLERLLDAKMGGSAMPGQIKAMILKPDSGIKQEEIKWTGVLQAIDRIAEENGGKVPKAALLEYLRNEGAVRFEEVRLGGRLGERYDPELVKRINDIAHQMRIYREDTANVYGDDRTKWPKEVTHGPEITRLKAEHSRLIRERDDKAEATETQHSKWQLPGGENYREVVLAIPIKAAGSGQTVTFSSEEAADSFLTDMDASGLSDMDYGRSESYEYAVEFNQPITSNVRALIDANYGTVIQGQSDEASHAYTSTHFPDVPNYVAHMRLNERTDAEGKPGVFIEEIQSDRHQAGREKGYRTATENDVAKAKEAKTAFLDRLIPKYGNRPSGQATQREIDAYVARFSQDELDEFNVLNEAVNDAADRSRGVPDAPFRTTWPLALFKRALRDAVESGKEWIGWTAGETQNERYDLSKQVDSIGWIRDATGASLTVMKDGSDVTGDLGLNRRVSFEEMPGIIGKDATTKIIEGGRTGKLAGNDLKVGGSGMKGFYDLMMPKEVQKYVKQWGAKVESAKLPAPDGAKVVARYGGTFEIQDANGNVLEADLMPEEVSAARKRHIKDTPIHRINITPEMRESVQTQGQALFAQGPSRAYESMTFDPPFETSFGQIEEYHWKSRADGAKLVSDWSQAKTNPETGRKIVHHFRVRDNRGNLKTVSLETAMGLLTAHDRARLGGVIRSEIKRRNLEDQGQMRLFSQDSMPFGSWAASTREDGILFGYRGEAEGGNAFGATEGHGLYIGRDKGVASFFGDVRRVTFPVPKNPLVVDEDSGGEVLPMLNEDNDAVWDDIMSYDVNEGDSPWIAAHKRAAKSVGLTDENYNQKGEAFTRALTAHLLRDGYDAVLVRSGGEEWTVLLTAEGKQLVRGTRSPGGEYTLYAQSVAAQDGDPASGSQSVEQFKALSAGYDSFEQWSDQSRNTPGRLIARAVRSRGATQKQDYELRYLPWADITPSQTGEDYLNDSSRETARKIRTGEVLGSRLEDIAPVIVDGENKLIDGNHRHAAAEINGDRVMLALVPVGEGTGQVVNLREFYDGLQGGEALYAQGSDFTFEELGATIPSMSAAALNNLRVFSFPGHKADIDYQFSGMIAAASKASDWIADLTAGAGIHTVAAMLGRGKAKPERLIMNEWAPIRAMFWNQVANNSAKVLEHAQRMYAEVRAADLDAKAAWDAMSPEGKAQTTEDRMRNAARIQWFEDEMWRVVIPEGFNVDAWGDRNDGAPVPVADTPAAAAWNLVAQNWSGNNSGPISVEIDIKLAGFEGSGVLFENESPANKDASRGQRYKVVTSITSTKEPAKMRTNDTRNGMDKNAVEMFETVAALVNGAEVGRGDAWDKVLPIAREAKMKNKRALIFVDPPYWRGEEKGGGKNYADEVAVGASRKALRAKIKDVLGEANRLGARVMFTNDWDAGLAQELRDSGYYAAGGERAKTSGKIKPEVVGFNWNIRNGNHESRPVDFKPSERSRKFVFGERTGRGDTSDAGGGEIDGDGFRLQGATQAADGVAAASGKNTGSAVGVAPGGVALPLVSPNLSPSDPDPKREKVDVAPADAQFREDVAARSLDLQDAGHIEKMNMWRSLMRGMGFTNPQATRSPLTSDDPPRLKAQSGIDAGRIDELERKALGEKPGERTVGHPDYAFSTTDALRMATDAYYREKLQVEAERTWIEAAEQMMRDALQGRGGMTYEGLKMELAAKGARGESLSPVQTKLAQMVIAKETGRGMAQDPQGRMELIALMWGYRQTGTEAARALRSRVDPHKTPAERWRDFVARDILLPPPAEQRKIEDAPPLAQKEAEISKLRERLAQAIQRNNDNERRLAEADLKNMQNVPSREDMLADWQRRKVDPLIEKLKKHGLTLDDIMGNKVEMSLIGSAYVQDALAGVTGDHRRVYAAMVAKAGGQTRREIAAKLGLTEARFVQLGREVIAAVKDQLRDKVRHGFTREDIVTEQVQFRFAGGQQPAESLGAQKIDDKGVILDDAKTEAELDYMVKMMGLIDPGSDSFDIVRVVKPKPKRRPRKGKPPRVLGVDPDEDAPGVNRTGETEAEKRDRLEKLSNERGPFPVAQVFDSEDMVQQLHMRRMLSIMKGGSWVDYAMEVGLANLLSAPITHATNMIGYMYGAYELFFKRGVESAWHGLRGGKKGAASFAEFKPMFDALPQAFGRAFTNAQIAWSTETPMFEKTFGVGRSEGNPEFASFKDDMEVRAFIPDRVMGIGREGGRDIIAAAVAALQGKAYEGISVGRTVRIPFKTLLLVDDFMRALIGITQAAGIAHRMGKGQGLSGAALKTFINEQLITPGSAAFQVAASDAQRYAYMTPLKSFEQMKNDPDSDISNMGEGVIRMMQDLKNADTVDMHLSKQIGMLIFRTTFPFLRTPYRLLEAGLYNTIIGGAWELHRGQRSRTVQGIDGKVMKVKKSEAERIASQAHFIASFLVFAALLKAAEGDDDDEEKMVLITGSMPQNRYSRGRRDLGYRTIPPYSIVLGGARNGIVIDYRRWDPFSTLFATSVDSIREVKARLRGGSYGDMHKNILASVFDQVNDKASMQGLSELSRLARGEKDLAQEAVSRLASYSVPNLLKNPARNADQYFRDNRTEPFAPESIIDQFAPGPWSDAPARVTATGETAERPGNWFTRTFIPGNPHRAKDFHMLDEFYVAYNRAYPEEAFGPTVPEPTYQVAGESMRMSAKQYNEFFLPLWASLLSTGMAEAGLLGNTMPMMEDKRRESSIRAQATRRAKEIMFGQ